MRWTGIITRQGRSAAIGTILQTAQNCASAAMDAYNTNLTGATRNVPNVNAAVGARPPHQETRIAMTRRVSFGPAGIIMITLGAALCGFAVGNVYIHNSWGIFPGMLWLLGMATAVDRPSPGD